MDVRHFLTVPDLSKTELEEVLAQAATWKQSPIGASARGQDGGAHLRQAFHAHAGVVQRGGASDGRHAALLAGAGSADAQVGEHRGHGARVVALRGRHRDPHVRPEGRGRTGRRGVGAGDQRPHR